MRSVSLFLSKNTNFYRKFGTFEIELRSFTRVTTNLAKKSKFFPLDFNRTKNWLLKIATLSVAVIKRSKLQSAKAA